MKDVRWYLATLKMNWLIGWFQQFLKFWFHCSKLEHRSKQKKRWHLAKCLVKLIHLELKLRHMCNHWLTTLHICNFYLKFCYRTSLMSKLIYETFLFIWILIFLSYTKWIQIKVRQRWTTLKTTKMCWLKFK